MRDWTPGLHHITIIRDTVRVIRALILVFNIHHGALKSVVTLSAGDHPLSVPLLSRVVHNSLLHKAGFCLEVGVWHRNVNKHTASLTTLHSKLADINIFLIQNIVENMRLGRQHEIYSVTTKFECFDATWRIIIVRAVIIFPTLLLLNKICRVLGAISPPFVAVQKAAFLLTINSYPLPSVNNNVH